MPTVVVYHHISDRPDPLVDQLGIGTDPDVFLRQMRYFARNFDLVTAAELIGPRPPPRALLVTFDDAYRSVLDVAAPILRSLDAPAIFFLNPGTVLAQTLPIDNLLSLAVSRLGLREVLSRLNLAELRPASAGDLLADHVSTLTQAGTEVVKARLLSLLGTTIAEIRAGSRLFLDEPDIGKLADYRVAVGNHSMTHSFFRSLSRAELEREIADSRVALERLSGQPVRELAVPYGNETDATEPVLEVARGSGHRAIFLVHGRSNLFRAETDVFYRINPRHSRPAALPLRLRVAPVLRTIVKRLS